MFSKKFVIFIILYIISLALAGYWLLYVHTKNVIESYKIENPKIISASVNYMEQRWFKEASSRIYTYAGIIVGNKKWTLEDVEILKSMVISYNTEAVKYKEFNGKWDINCPEKFSLGYLLNGINNK